MLYYIQDFHVVVVFHLMIEIKYSLLQKRAKLYLDSNCEISTTKYKFLELGYLKSKINHSFLVVIMEV